MVGIMKLMKGAELGAGLMYFLDPDLGPSRRAQVSERAMRIVEESEEWVLDTARNATECVEDKISDFLDDPAKNWTSAAQLALGAMAGVAFLRIFARTAPLTFATGVGLVAAAVASAGIREPAANQVEFEDDDEIGSALADDESKREAYLG